MDFAAPLTGFRIKPSLALHCSFFFRHLPQVCPDRWQREKGTWSCCGAGRKAATGGQSGKTQAERCGRKEGQSTAAAASSLNGELTCRITARSKKLLVHDHISHPDLILLRIIIQICLIICFRI